MDKGSELAEAKEGIKQGKKKGLIEGKKEGLIEGKTKGLRFNIKWVILLFIYFVYNVGCGGEI